MTAHLPLDELAANVRQLREEADRLKGIADEANHASRMANQALATAEGNLARATFDVLDDEGHEVLVNLTQTRWRARVDRERAERER